MLPVALYAKIVNDWFRDISTHTPLAGRDFVTRKECDGTTEFQLTRPLRGVTLPGDTFDVSCAISTHTPLAGRDSERVG